MPNVSETPSLAPYLYSKEELLYLGFHSCGANVRIDRSVRFFGVENISIGDNVRIDCFSIISASPHGVRIGSHVHIGPGCYLFGGGGSIVMDDFSGLSSRVSLYTSTDDFVLGYLTNPTIPDRYRRVRSASIEFQKHSLVGSGCIVLPGVTLGFGASAGALTVLRKSVKECEIVVGNPAKTILTRRSREKLMALEVEYLASIQPESSP